MTSTELNFGIDTNNRPSSRVLKPPGGGHTDLFGEPDVKPNPPRPKYNQQNSSNLNACMNTADANITLKQVRDEPSKEAAPVPAPAPKQADKAAIPNGTSEPPKEAASAANTPQSRGRIPPGGFSSGGFW